MEKSSLTSLQNPDSSRITMEQKRASVKAVAVRVMNLLGDGNHIPYNMIIEFAKEFRKRHPDASKFILFHDLIGSTTRPETESMLIFDTEDGEIEQFTKKLADTMNSS